MSGGPVDVAVAVVTYNSRNQVADLLRSIPDAMGDCRYRVVVADNASADDTVDVVRAADPGALVVEMGRNAGYSAGVNAAVAAAGPARAVYVLNPDVRLHPASVPPLVQALDVPGTGIAVPRLQDGAGNLAHSLRREPSVLRALGQAVLGGRRSGRWSRLGELVCRAEDYATPGWADWASGCALLISSRCLDEVGPWDESLFLYAEEIEFALRARDHGWRLRYEPTATATHLGGTSHESPRLWSMVVFNKWRVFRRRHGPVAGAAFRAALALNEVLRLPTGRPTHRAALGALVFRHLRPPEVRT